MEFAEVAREVFKLHGEARYREGADLVAHARAHLPKHDSRLTYWEACLVARAGDPEDAVELLLAGTERGLWWPEGMLTDGDLDPLRRLAEWQAVVAACQFHERARMASRPAIRWRRGRGGGTVVALHGSGGDPDEFADRWESVIPERWGVASPIGTVPIPDGGWSWGHHPLFETDDVSRQLSTIELTLPILVIGFSAGATVGIGLVTREALDASCLMLMSPYLPDSEATSTLASVGCPIVLVYGARDPEIGQYESLSEAVTDTMIVPELGHALPQDLNPAFDAALRVAADRHETPKS